MRIAGNTVVAALTLLLGIRTFAEDYPAWGHHADLLLNTSPTGANIAGPVAGFPLLVRLTDSVFAFAEARGQGQDIRFTNAAGTVLPYEIDRWDSAGKAAEIWVKVDTIRGNSQDQILKMHWGNAAAASASDGAAVFSDGSGFVSVWHLGGTGSRPNAVAGGLAAVPNGYPANASRAGVIGKADSLTGGTQGSYLDIGDGYGMFNAGFTFSAWVNPAAAGYSVHFLDIGNGGGADNIAVGRYHDTQNLSFVTYGGSTASNLVFGNAALAPDTWQNVAVTVSGNAAKMYRNGALIASEILTQPIVAGTRTSNFLGRGNWASNDYYQGKMDEPRLAKVAQGADWIKLSYENQRPDQQVVHFGKTAVSCAESFSASSDSTVTEGSILELVGVADCATEFHWDTMEGPTPRILDPEVKSLRVLVPRVTRDTSMRYRFSASFGAAQKSRDIVLHVKEAIPDPVFTLAPYLEWDGKANLVIQPQIANLTAVITSASPSIQYQWTLPDAAADTSMLDGALMLKPDPKSKDMKIGLCLDNGGASSCHQMEVQVYAGSVSIVPVPAMQMQNARSKPGHDLRGRSVPAVDPRKGWTTLR